MLIGDAAMRAIENVHVRERRVLAVFAPEQSAAGERGLQVTAPPGAFFVTADTAGRRLFTRDGSFAVRDGAVLSAAGDPVLGAREAGDALAPLRIDPVDLALGASNVRIDGTGALLYDRVETDPRTGRRETRTLCAGRFALARFAPGTKLQALDGERAAAPPGVLAHVGFASDGAFAALTPAAAMPDSAELDRRLQEMQEAYLALDAVRSAVKSQDGVQKTTMDLLK